MITFPAAPLALVLAQVAPAAGPSSFTPIIIQFGLIVAIIYFAVFH